jgi:hypothetical protein
VGFAVWLDKECAWAQGTHEYRPMGAAVIAAANLFTPRDFSVRRRPPGRQDPRFAGFFASLGDVNSFLQKSRSQLNKIKFPGAGSSYLPYF